LRRRGKDDGRGLQQAGRWVKPEEGWRGRISTEVPIETVTTTTYLGKRCRGQGTRPNSWGTLNTKLKIWGMKNKSKVLEKCPWIATTANAIPAK
jgi:hypothetical protein